MDEQLSLLVELQALDTKILQESRLLGAIPRRISESENKLRDAEGVLVKAKGDLENIDKKRRERDAALDETRQRLKKLKDRSDLKDTKSFQAHQKEIDTAERTAKEQTADLAKSTEDHAKVSARVKDAEAVVAARTKELADLKASLASDEAAIGAKIKDLKARRPALVKKLHKDSYHLYKTIMNLHSGLAVVPAESEICSGCHMNIMPQLFVKIRKNNELLSCPQCRRILYWPGETQPS